MEQPEDAIEVAEYIHEDNEEKDPFVLVGCGACDTVFYTDRALREHRQAAGHYFECRTCLSTFMEHDEMRVHFYVTSHGCHRCPACVEFWTPDLDELEDHVATAHADFVPDPRAQPATRLAVGKRMLPGKPRAYYSRLQANGEARVTLSFNK